MATIYINNQPFESHDGARTIDAVRQAGIDIPGLCYKNGHPSDNHCQGGACRLCQVEIGGQISAACEQTVYDEMQIRTDTAAVREAQRLALTLICEDHAGRCLDCPANLHCDLRQTVGRFDSPQLRMHYIPPGNIQRRGGTLFDLAGHASRPVETMETPALAYDASLCILCGRCAAACPTGAIGPVGRGVNKRMGPPPGMAFEELCISCGQCIKVCPTGALNEKSAIGPVESALEDPGKRVVFQIAPAVRVALGELFGLPPGKIVTGKIYAALRQLGSALPEGSMVPAVGEDGELFDRPLRSNVLVTDTNVTADLTILEEGTELINRIQNGGALPILTSCCPGWVKYMESYYPELSEHISTCKSPQQMMGALTKTYGAETWGIDPAEIVTVSIMPCTAKKYEAQRPEMNDSGYQDVDYVLTTRELARMLQARGMDISQFEEEEADYPFEEYTGAATIFGNTGGVMEAALRTVHKVVTGEELAGVDFEPARGMEALKVAPVQLGEMEVKVAVMHKLRGDHVPGLLDQIRDGTQDPALAAVEIMACPGGCIGGGGQPKEFDWTTKRQRTCGLNEDDASRQLRRSHESPVVERIYAEFLEAPNSHQAHELCHTEYKDRQQVSLPYKETIR